MAVDFNRVIDRTGTYSTQWDYAADRFGRADVLPFSISDTDFPVPEEVEEALLERLRHPIFGYTRWNHADYKQSVVRWFQRDGSAQGFDPEWVVYSPSVIFSVASVIRLLTAPGEGVITCTPMYDAFYGVIEGNGRRIAAVRQASAMEGYGLDWDALERVASDPRNRVMLLTNPHNPTGKVYTADELARIHGICREHGVTLISDDIHRDVVYAPVRYTPVLDVSTEGALIACSSSKTFNTPGLIGSYCLIPDPVLRERFLFELKQRNALSSVSVPGMVAQMAAYVRCDAYVSDMVEHLAHNMALVEEFVEKEVPGVSFVAPQGTYLAWMDASGLGMSPEEVQDRLVNRGRVGIMSGGVYGDARCLRMNVACPRSKLVDGLERMRAALVE